jgi:alkylhydroperoxidase family enzyme
MMKRSLTQRFGRLLTRTGMSQTSCKRLLLAPKGLAAFAALSNYTQYGSQLTPLQRELVTLIAVRDVHYGWTHQNRWPERLGYAFEITAQRRVPQRVAEAMREHFGPRQIVDIALLTSCSPAVAALALALEVPIEPDETLRFEQDWQQR